MAIVGDASIIVRAITTSVPGDIRRGFNGVDRLGRDAGNRMGSAFSNAFRRNSSGNTFSDLSKKIKEFMSKADGLREAFVTADRYARFMGTGISALIGAISSVIGGIVALGANALGAAASLTVLGNAAFAGVGAMATLKLALGGVGRALGLANKAQAGGGGAARKAANDQKAAAAAREAAARRVQDAEQALARTIESNRESLVAANKAVRQAQLDVNKAIIAGREEIQQIGFDAEDAALAEKSAALELAKARDTLAGVQDLPPNNRARQEAELAYQEADLNYRRAVDRNNDTAKENDDAVKNGVKGTDTYVNATQNLQSAEEDRAKTVRDNARAEADARQGVIDALKAQKDAQDKVNAAAAGGGGGGGVDPFAGLNAAQVRFVKFLLSLKPMYDQLKLTASNALLPPLEEAIRIFAYGLFPTVNKGIGEIGRALGGAAIGFATIITNSRNLTSIATLFTSSARIISFFGTIVGNYMTAALTLMSAAAPLAERFAKFLAIASGNLSQSLLEAQNSGALADFFQRSGDAAAQLGNVFGNLFKGLGNIINANLGPGTGGGYLLDWVQDASQGFLDMTRNTGPLKDYFMAVAVNFKSIGSSVGALIKQLVLLGANPAIGQTFDILKTGAPLLGEILNNTAAAGPAFARLIVALLRIVRVFADTKSLNVFFGILGAIAEKLADIVESPAVTNFLNFIGPIFAGLSAVFLAGELAINGILIALSFLAAPIVGVITIVGTLGRVFGTIAGLITPIIATISQAFAFMTYSANPFVALLGRLPMLLGPIGIFIGAFVLLYTTSKQFRESINQLAGTLFQALGTAFTQIMAAVQPLIGVITGQLLPAFGSIMTALMPVISTLLLGLVGVIVQLVIGLLPTFVAIISTVAQVLTTVLSAVIPLVVALVTQLAPVITQIITIFFQLVTTLISAVLPVFNAVIAAILPLITTIIGALVPAITAIIAAILPLVTNILTIFINLLTFLMPIITFVAQLLGTVLVFAVNVLSGILQGLMAVVVLVINILAVQMVAGIGILNGVIAGISTVVKAVTDFFVGAWTNAKRLFDTVIGAIVTFVKRQFGAILQFFKDWDFQKYWETTWNNVKSFFKTIWGGIETFFKGTGNNIIGLVEGIINGVINIINGGITAWDALWDKVKDATGGAVNFHINPVAKVHVPRLAAGGTVMPSAGGSLVTVAEAGRPERIEPLDAQGLSQRDRAIIAQMAPANAGNVQIIVNPPPGASNAEIATMVSREIAYTMRKGTT